MKQRTRLLKILMLVLCALAAPISLRAAFFAGGLVHSQFVTSFGSGLVTGAPDAGGLFLGDTFDPPAHPGFITVSFSTPSVPWPRY